MIASLMIVVVLNAVVFFDGIPKVNREKISRIGKDIRDEVIIFKNTFTYKLSTDKIDYESTFGDPPNMEFEVIIPTPTSTLTPSPIVKLIEPTEIPQFIEPSVYLPPTKIPTKKPIRKPTKVPTPIFTPVPEEEISSPLFISNPLDQPYYNPRLAYKCYNPENFIRVYGGGSNPGSCYANAKAYVEKNLTSVSILGKSITVHKMAYPAFKAVADKLKNYKDYKINTIGAYIFRCNVNASTSGKNDLCSEGCVLSAHSFGIAVDINWEENCNGCSKFTMPREIIDAFESYGFRWGGRYKSIFGATIDPMHFEYMVDLCKDVD